MELRDYQIDAIEAIMSSNANCLINASTGSGKSIMFCCAIRDISRSGQKCLVLAHRGELIRQAVDKLFMATGLESCVFSAYLKRKELGNITVASIQSLARYEGELNFDYVFVDEVHRLPPMDIDSQYSKVLTRIGAQIIGFTATPYRMNGGLIYGQQESWFKNLNYSIGTKELIKKGFLVPFTHKVSDAAGVMEEDLRSVRKRGGEYVESDLAEVAIKPVHMAAVIQGVEDHGTDRKSIVVFCVNIEHAEKLKELIPEAEIVHSKANNRKESLERFDSGQSRWMLNVGVLTEGWDCTRVDCVVLARPTMSTALYVQMVGRGLRIHEGKENCLILDPVGNGKKHGLVDNPCVLVAGKQKKKKEPKAWICENCFEMVDPEVKICPVCETEKPVQKQELVDQKYYQYENYERHDLYIVGGNAEYYTARSGNECIKVSLFSNRNRWFYHYYPLGQDWIGSKFAKIINKFYHRDVGSWLHPERFMDAINGQHIFPLESHLIRDGKYQKVSGF